MAGVGGRSGGKRANAGRRPGAKHRVPRLPQVAKVVLPALPAVAQGAHGATRSLREAIEQYVDRVVAVLIKMVEDDKEPGANRLAAAAQLLDRHSGRPANITVDATPGGRAPREFQFIRRTPPQVTVVEQPPVEDLEPSAKKPALAGQDRAKSSPGASHG
jgi:hypothetical protein